jgi:flagellar biosynthesis protein
MLSKGFRDRERFFAAGTCFRGMQFRMPGGMMEELQKKNKAVALAYRPETDNAPKVVASGRGGVARRIIEIAREHGIYIHDDPDLVETLSQLDLNDEIPADLYIVVSELLAFVYALNRKISTDRE